MVKKSKKLIAMLLCIVMVLPFTACGKKEKTEDASSEAVQEETKTDDATTEDATAEEASTDTAAETTEVADDVYPEFDLGGRTIKVGLWWDYYYTSDHDDIADDPGLSNAETAQMKLDNVRRIEQKYNCKIQFVNLGWEGIIESINTSILAGTPECDVYLSDLQFGIPAVQNGLAIDLSTIGADKLDLFNDQVVLKRLDAMGGTYLFTEQGLPVSGIYLGYNATMLESLGLEDPQALYEKGEWTWDKFKEYCKAGTQDTDGDSTTDIYGFGGIFTDAINGFVLNNGGNIAAGETEGLSSKPVTEVLDLMNQLYNVDQSARPWNADDWNDNLLAWSDGKVLFWTAQAWALKQEADAAVAEGAELPFEYHVVPYPVGPSGDGTISSPVSGNYYFLPVGTKEPEKVLQVFEEFMNWHNFQPEYRDDPTWIESCFQTEKDLEICYACGQHDVLDLWNGKLGGSFDFGKTVWFPLVVDKTSTVAQAVESSKQVLQDDINNFYKKK
ncbi:MAG TPA: extracellular solute-binding protein [Lachnospiraceae bacterium]|nr:extracellular solute-binding protein [Lachnospiraceae bacterium]